MDAQGKAGSEASKVYLVGAGPGDPDLITVRGWQLVQRCDALVYDSLVPPEIVAKSPAVEKLYVGKTEGGHSLTQDEITELIVDLATRPDGPKLIVRLKGGDPYVFGRGGEEALACAAAGVPFEIVPGVTAGVAAPAYAGVPITHRSISRGAIFFTGHLAHGNLEHLPWESLAKSGFTLVTYMGVKTLPEVSRRLMDAGLAAQTPAMVVQEGTTPGQRSVRAPLSEIAAVAAAAEIRPPSLVIIGPVVGLADELGPQRPRPLAGKTVVLVKAEESNYEELSVLRAEGARCIEVPVVRCVAGDRDEELAACFEAMRAVDTIFFRSAVAARFFSEAWRQLPSRAQPRIVAGGPTVREALRRQGFEVAYTADGQASLVKTLQAAAVPEGSVVWLPRSAGASRLPTVLTEAGYQTAPMRVYETRPVPVPADVSSILAGGRVDAVLFLSGTCVRAAVEAAPGLAAAKGVVFGAVGPLTAEQAADVGIHCAVVPERPRVADLVAAVDQALRRTDAP